MPWKKIFLLTPRMIAALILLQTLLYKFGIGGTEYLMESQHLFGSLMIALTGSPEYESVFRIGTGVLELVTAIFILVPSWAWAGGVLGVGLMSGAILSHLLLIGISINEDGGQLLFTAIAVMICCIKILYDERHKIKEGTEWLT